MERYVSLELEIEVPSTTTIDNYIDLCIPANTESMIFSDNKPKLILYMMKFRNDSGKGNATIL